MHSKHSLLLALLLTASGFPAAKAEVKHADAVVGAHVGANFKTLQEAINAAPQTTSAAKPWTILLKSGTYREVVYIQREKRFLRIVGEDASNTVVTYNLNANLPGPDGKPLGTFRTPTVFVDADDISFENLTFENSAGAVGQALALRVDGDRVAFRKCRFLGFQDTILANRGRQYFKSCQIVGAVDFIFGGATAFFEECQIHCVRNGFVTAASTPEDHAFGFVFSSCKIDGETPKVKTLLGRPWRPYASVVYLNTEMTEVVRPEGWHNWGKPERESTARYSEFQSKGAGALPEGRVKWAKQLSKEEAEKITVATVLGDWNPE
jgi:pectinesterase